MNKSDTEWLQKLISGRAELPGTENQSDSQTLVEQAIEYLKVAHEKVQTAELAKCAAEAELARFRNEVKSDINIKLLELEVRMQAVIPQLAAAGQRATAAEERANKAEATVKRLEDELQARKTKAGATLLRAAA